MLCRAKAFSGKKGLFGRCSHKAVGQGFCTRHLLQPPKHGLWLEEAEEPAEEAEEEAAEEAEEEAAEEAEEAEEKGPAEEAEEKPAEDAEEKPAEEAEKKPAEEAEEVEEKPAEEAEEAEEKPTEEAEEKLEEGQARKPAEDAEEAEEKPAEEAAKKAKRKAEEKPAEEAEEKPTYFFPAEKKRGHLGFDHSKPMQPESVRQAMVEVAKFNGLVKNQDHEKRFDCNSIRRGTASDTADLLRQTLGELNSRRGRQPGSQMDLARYCPKSVLVKPGLLHTDVPAINRFFEEKAEEASQMHQWSLLCSICGYPNCNCQKCSSVLKGGGRGASTKHKCWLADRGRGKQARNQVRESQQQAQERRNAWMLHNVSNPPTFKDYRFTFN